MEFKVYWTDRGQTHSQIFQDVGQALNYCQDLRSSGCSFVTMASQMNEMVGEFGVKEVDADYNWTKRR
jgi:hypothetical protein